MTPPVVVLDSTPLGMASNPKATTVNDSCKRWLRQLLARDCRVIIPGIADHEIRRELILHGKLHGLRRLNELCAELEFLPVTQQAFSRAAELWATARKEGRPTAGQRSLDADAILAAQVLLLDDPDAVIATANVGHLTRLAPAALWHEIT